MKEELYSDYAAVRAIVKREDISHASCLRVMSHDVFSEFILLLNCRGTVFDAGMQWNRYKMALSGDVVPK